MYYNRLEGTIPPELANLPKVTTLDLMYNNFVEPFPLVLCGLIQGQVSVNADICSKMRVDACHQFCQTCEEEGTCK